MKERSGRGAPSSPRRLLLARAAGGGLAAALLGAAVVLVAFGPAVVDPHSVGWMLAGPLGPDPVQYLLGWTYFVRSPWMLPPGLNPDYGLEIGTSIFYADAVPLLALLFKALRGVATVPQYWGAWLLGCGVAQALLAWRLLGLATPDPLARVAGAGLFVLQPMLLTRMGGHFALAGQWTLLAALWLALRPSGTAAGAQRGGRLRQGLAWSLLLLATSLVHAYLLAMVLALWAADLLRRAMPEGWRAPPDPATEAPGKWRLSARLSAEAPGNQRLPARLVGAVEGRRSRLACLAGEAVLAPAAAALGLWAGGFFVLHAGHGAPGYGSLGLDLLAPFDATEWGAILPAMPGLHHGESGGSYLGLGALLLLAAGAISWARHPAMARPVLRRHWPLLAVLFGLLAFAVTHRVTLGGLQARLFEPPGWALALAGSLRASERFFWPLGYALLVGAVAAVARDWGGRRAGLLLAACLVLQAVDLRHGLTVLRGYVAAAPRDAPERLPDPFWDEAGRVYRRVRAAPAANQGADWESVARFAMRHGMPTDSIYLARIDAGAVEALRAKVAAILASGRYEPGMLYILRDETTLRLAATSHDPARDLLAEVDGLHVLAPGWFPAHGVPPGARRIAAAEATAPGEPARRRPDPVPPAGPRDRPPPGG